MLFYIDGQSIGNEQKGQPRKARIALVYQPSPPDPSKARVLSENLGDKTNNEAEYLALIRLLSLLSTNGAGRTGGRMPRTNEHVRILSDSKLVVNQVNGEWKVDDERLTRLWEEAQSLAIKVGPIILEWVPREKNYAGLWLEGKFAARRAEAEEFLANSND